MLFLHITRGSVEPGFNQTNNVGMFSIQAHEQMVMDKHLLNGVSRYNIRMLFKSFEYSVEGMDTLNDMYQRIMYIIVTLSWYAGFFCRNF